MSEARRPTSPRSAPPPVRRWSGGGRLFYVDGLELIHPDELDGLADDFHPNDQGFHLLSTRLAPVVRRAIDAGLPADRG